MIKITQTNSKNNDFQELVTALDADLAVRDGEEHGFYAQFNSIAHLQYVVVAYDENQAVGCGAIKPYDAKTMEVKRMFVVPELRGKGIASLVLKALEDWALTLGYKNCILETGLKQPEAIALYHKNQYHVIPNYGQYAGVENSVCFEKKLG